MPGVKINNASASRWAWADGPIPLIKTPTYTTGATDIFTAVASQMAIIHNSIIRGYNSIFLQARNVSLADYKDFVGYAYAWYELLDAHHRGEEEYVFLMIKEQVGIKGFMQPNIEQHEAFYDGLKEYAAYLKSLCSDASAFSGAKLLAIMDSFGPAPFTHFNDEIPTLLALSQYATKLNVQKIIDEEGDKTMGALSKVSGLPFFFLNHDLMFEEGLWAEFPPVPKPLKWALCHVFTYYNQNWWKFASCDTYGRPKPLYCPDVPKVVVEDY